MQAIIRSSVVVFVSVVLLRLFVMDSFIVRGDSMAPTVLNYDYVFINKLAYRFGNEPKRGDLVVLANQNTKQKHIIKRVIALPKERIVIENGGVRIKESRDENGVVLQEEYLSELLRSPKSVLLLKMAACVLKNPATKTARCFKKNILPCQTLLPLA